MRPAMVAIILVLLGLAWAAPGRAEFPQRGQDGRSERRHGPRDDAWHHRRHRELNTQSPAEQLGQSLADLANAIADLKHGNRIQVQNRSGAPVRLVVHYLPKKGGWQTVGQWILAPYESSFLAHQNVVLRTRNTILYWFAEEIDGDRVWNGPQAIPFEGRTVGMRMYQRSPDRDGVLRLRIDP